jgi:pimeloyl-ACP methyl ester carboxylesterase/DNA-binding SARP family transcriptional activator
VMLCLLGPIALSTEGAHQALRLRPKEWAVVARLALADGPVARADLARELFPDADDPRRALRWHLGDLRRRLPQQLREKLVADRDAVNLEVPTDVGAFRAGTAKLLMNPGGRGAEKTLALYRGDLCAGLVVTASPEFDTWLYVEQEGLRRLFRQGAIAHARWATAAGSPAAAVEPLSRLVAVDPYLEEGHVLLIETYEALGQQAAAHSAYQVYQRVVRRELQAEPRPELVLRYEGRKLAGRGLPEDNLVPLRDVTIHIVDWAGAEPGILGIHGSAGSAYSFTALGERLSPAHRFIGMDLRGHGFSDKPPSGYGLTSHVEDVRQLIGVLALERPVLLGFSLGGPVAAAVAASHDIGGLILLDAAIGDRSFLVKRRAQNVVPTEQTLELRFRDVDEYLRQWRAGTPRYSDEAERWLDRFARYELAPLPDGTYRRRGLRAALRDEIQSVLEADTLATLARVRCPTLLVRAAQPWIGEEPWLTDEIWEAQARACPLATRFVARASNHASLARDPEEDLIAAIDRFIRSQIRGRNHRLHTAQR